jgi:hypothetical protein
MTLLEWVVAIFEATPPGPDNASVFHKYLEAQLNRAGLHTTREVRCPRGPTRSGRIDIVVTCENEQLAIEVDWLKPRFKSLQKLRLFEGYRVVVLRRAKTWPYPLHGIDAVVCIPSVDPVEAFYASIEPRK